MASQTILLPLPAAPKLAPFGSYLYGQDYLHATKVRRPFRVHSMVPYFLCSQAIEHGLKAFLLSEGQTHKDIRKLGHNLTALLATAKGEGLYMYVKLTSGEEKTIKAATDFYDVEQGKPEKRKPTKRFQVLRRHHGGHRTPRTPGSTNAQNASRSA